MSVSRRQIAFFAACMLFSVPAYGADINGAWSTSAEVCDRMFVKKGNSVSIASDSDLYGNGFIIEGDKIIGKMATCNVKARKQDGAVFNLVAACATDIALSTMQLSFKIDNENKITRLFPGMPEMETPYFRCPL